MKVDFTARGLRLAPSVREMAESKLERLSKVLPEDAQAKVVIRREKKEVAVEVTVQARHRSWSATAEGAEQEVVVREALDHVEGQVRKTKARTKEEKKHSAPTVRRPESWEAEPAAAAEPRRAEVRAPKVEKVTPRPTFEEDAVHKFLKWDRQIFVYRDPSDDTLRILYRRRDGTLRILVPDV